MSEEEKVLPPVKRQEPYLEAFEVTLTSVGTPTTKATFTIFADSYVSALSYMKRMGFDCKLSWLGNAEDAFPQSFEPDITVLDNGVEGHIANDFVNNFLKEKDDNSSECTSVGHESPYVVVTNNAAK